MSDDVSKTFDSKTKTCQWSHLGCTEYRDLYCPMVLSVAQDSIIVLGWLRFYFVSPWIGGTQSSSEDSTNDKFLTSRSTEFKTWTSLPVLLTLSDSHPVTAAQEQITPLRTPTAAANPNKFAQDKKQHPRNGSIICLGWHNDESFSPFQHLVTSCNPGDQFEKCLM